MDGFAVVGIGQTAERRLCPSNLSEVSVNDRIHRVGSCLFHVVLAGGMGMLWFSEVFSHSDVHRGADVAVVAATSISGLAAIATAFLAERVLPAWGTAVAAISATATVGAVSGYVSTPLMAEYFALLAITAWCVRRWDARFGKVAVLTTAAATLLLPARTALEGTLGMVTALALFPLAAAIATGMYLRSADLRRKQALTVVRRGERMELASDLHDFVAHHVTGIVVQAQAAQYLPESDVQGRKEAFAAVEKAGVEALTSMRRLVAVMREGEDGAGVRPLGDLAQTMELVERFRLGDRVATCYVSPVLAADTLPPEIASSIYRVAQEGLTNVRKHAPSATAATVSINSVDSGVEVAVRDDATPGRPSLLGEAGGGYGLAGLTERVEALGGWLKAGRRPDGGWETVVWLPTAASRAEGEEP